MINGENEDINAVQQDKEEQDPEQAQNENLGQDMILAEGYQKTGDEQQHFNNHQMFRNHSQPMLSTSINNRNIRTADHMTSDKSMRMFLTRKQQSLGLRGESQESNGTQS